MKTKTDKKHTVCIAADLALCVLAMALAFLLRFRVFGGTNPVGGFGYHLLWAAVFSPVYIILYAFFGLYTPHPNRSYIHEFGRGVLCNTLGVMLYIDVIFLFRVVDFSRWMIVIFYFLLNLFTGTRGFLLHRTVRRQYRRGEGLQRLVILGGGRAAADCAKQIRVRRDSGYDLVGSIGPAAVPGLEYWGGYEDCAELLESGRADAALIAPDAVEADLVPELLRSCENTGVKLSLLPMGYENLSAHPRFEDLAELPVINVRKVPLDNFGFAVLKRTGDILGSLILIMLTSPLMLAAAVGTRLSSPGPILFRQERIGRDKKPFRMLKFRSMRLNAESDTAWTSEGDPRRTRFGAWMRRYSIDELPQLFNVLKGDMSLVGPRPEIPTYVNHFKYSVPLYMVRHRVRPGMTGWAQVNGLRGDTSIEKRVDYDLYYIENWSLFFDAKILLMTPFRFINRGETLQ